MAKLLTDGQLLSIQKVAELGMQTDVTIMRQTVTTGLETADGPYGSSISHASATDESNVTVKGMLHSVPDNVLTVDSGQLVAVHQHRLWLPVGTEVAPGDHLLIGGTEYVVNDTNADETWPAYLGLMVKTLE